MGANFDYESLIVDIPDYPEPGVVFKDIMPLLGDPQGFACVIDELVDHYIGKGITKVMSAEARGFLLGSAIAYRLSAGFVAARKPGKLPREVYSRRSRDHRRRPARHRRHGRGLRSARRAGGRQGGRFRLHHGAGIS